MDPYRPAKKAENSQRCGADKLVASAPCKHDDAVAAVDMFATKHKTRRFDVTSVSH